MANVPKFVKNFIKQHKYFLQRIFLKLYDFDKGHPSVHMYYVSRTSSGESVSLYWEGKTKFILEKGVKHCRKLK